MAYYLSIFLSFFIYSFCGWIWESLLLPITLKRHAIHNSGFLNGPIVPIYGVGAVVVYILFKNEVSPLSVFLSGAVVATTIEYITGWLLETFYHRRWWDYSDMKFNLHGRICLAGFLCFGIFSLIDVKYAEPLLIESISKLNINLLTYVSAVLLVFLSLDIVITVVSLLHLEEHIVSIEENFVEHVQQAKENLDIDKEVYKLYEQFLDEKKDMVEVLKELKQDPNIHALVRKRNYVNKRIVRAYPELLRGRKDEK